MAVKTINQILTDFGKKLVSDVGKSLDKKKDATGSLRKSINFKIKILKDNYSFNFFMEPHWKNVDEGRQKGKKGPPIKPNVILKWINDKKLKPKKGSKDVFKRKGLKVESVNISAAKGLAYVINRKIARDGIPATKFYSNVINDGRLKQLKQDIADSYKKDFLLQITQ